MTRKPITAIIVGAGHRSMIYASLALTHPEMLKIVGVADPNPTRRNLVRETFGFSGDMCFSSADELAKKGKLADAIINGTMDRQHVATSIPLLNAGYDMLLEKPFAVNEHEAAELLDCVRKNKSKVMICHVLRYTPFYYGIKERIVRGEIGDIINIQMSEHVSYRHLATAYVRGKWANQQKSGTTMLLAKSCHDMDLMMWLMDETEPDRISSFGGKYQFVPENAPEGAGEVCMRDCPHVDTCPYSTKKIYIERPDHWNVYVWEGLEHIDNPSLEDKIALMKSDSPYARCIYKCDNDIADRQSVLVTFKSGATGTHNMIGGSSKSMRKIHIIGTKGEIYGTSEDSQFTVLKMNPLTDSGNGECDIEIVNTKKPGEKSGPFGSRSGDRKLTMDFVNFVRGEETSLACTSIFDSMVGHMSVYYSDSSMLHERTVDVLLDDYRENI